MVYLDNNATTKIDKRVYHKQCEVLNKYYGNPSSLYPLGIDAKEIVSIARKQVAYFINADIQNGDRIIFTSCATESNNSVLNSVLQPNMEEKHIIISSVEHPSIFSPAKYYESIGCKVTYIGVDENGMPDEKQLLSAITDDTVLISMMLVNSETGVIHNIEQITAKVRAERKSILIHTDAVQAAGKIPIDVKKLGVDFLTLSGHKFHAPKGVGILYIKSGIPFVPFMQGGHQESGLRSGTENTAAIAAMGEAAMLADNKLKSGTVHKVELLRDMMEEQLLTLFPNAVIFGKQVQRIGNTTNIGFKNILGDKLVLQLARKGIFVSSGTACNSSSAQPSRVLKAMGASEEYIRSIRISLCCDTTETEIQMLINVLKEIV